MRIEKRTACFFALLLMSTYTPALRSAEVTGRVRIATAKGTGHPVGSNGGVVLWLTPLDTASAHPQTISMESPHPRLIQRNKVFDPHILAVQVGSVVDFPNHDPFFHNVFSLFNGKRFDLGLYEAGSTRGVRFDRAGVCYIFCNIHSQMSAVVVVVETPYYAVSDGRGDVVIPSIAYGRYQLNLWEEHCAPKTLDQLSRQVSVEGKAVSLGGILLRESAQPAVAHLNKYGNQYDPEVFSSPLYVSP
jgi:plastocyanin